MNPIKPLALAALWLYLGAKLPGHAQVRLPLVLIDKLIVLEAKVNYQHTGYFILDTGSSHLTLNAKYFRGDPSGSTPIYGLHEEVTSYESRRVDIEIGNHIWKAKEALIMDLAHLERISPVPYKILGLLGLDFFKNMELEIDFMEGHISFRPSTEIEVGFIPSAPFGIVLPFQEKSGLPVIDASIGGQPFRLGIDSGAGINVLDERHQDELSVSFGKTGSSMTLGIGGRKKRSFVARLSGVYLNSMPLGEMLTQFQDLSLLRNRLFAGELDGLLGLEFLKQGKLKLDFKNKQLSFQFKYHQDAIRRAGVISGNADTSMLRPPGN